MLPSTPDIARLDEAGVEFLWNTSPHLHTMLALRGRLSPALRKKCIKYPRADVRTQFALRSDLTLSEFEALLADKAATPRRALFTAPLDEGLLLALATHPDDSIKDRLLGAWEKVKLTRSTEATKLLLNRAFSAAFTLPTGLPWTTASAVAGLLGQVNVEVIDSLPYFPTDSNLAANFSTNKNIWYSSRRPEILAAAVSSRQYRNLGNSVLSVPDEHGPFLTKEERELLSQVVSGVRVGSRLADLARDPELIAREQAEAQRLSDERAAVRDRHTRLIDYAASADPVLVRIACSQAKELPASVAGRILSSALASSVVSEATVLSEFSGDVSIEFALKTVRDPMSVLNEVSRMETVTYKDVQAVARGLPRFKGGPYWPMISSWVCMSADFMTVAYRADEILSIVRPESFALLPLSAFHKWKTSSCAHSWLIGEVVRLAAATSTDPATVYALVEGMLVGGLPTAGDVLLAATEVLSIGSLTFEAAAPPEPVSPSPVSTPRVTHPVALRSGPSGAAAAV